MGEKSCQRRSGRGVARRFFRKAAIEIDLFVDLLQGQFKSESATGDAQSLAVLQDGASPSVMGVAKEIFRMTAAGVGQEIGP